MITTTSAPEAPAEPGQARKRPRGTWGRTAVLGALVVALLIGAAAWYGQGRWWGTPPRPYADPSAIGRLTLCSNGDVVTKGSIDQPLADAVRGPAIPTSAQATLYAYQPRNGALPTEWTGIPISAPAAYGTATPLASLKGSITVKQFVAGYPARDDGYVELRLLVAEPGQPLAVAYNALDLHIRGDHWTAVDPGRDSCRG